MWKTIDIRIFLLILSFLTSMKTTELLSDQKKCGDPECETSIIRVQAIKDYTGPDCRYLSFKPGEEIMVYFKLSRKSENLWAGSKGKDFGYFPMDTVQIEEVFVTEEVEVPTKETDFLCLDGGEYAFENKDSIFNIEDKDNEYITLYTDEIHSKLNKPKDEAPEITDISFTEEYKELFLDSDESDSKSKDQHTLETTRHGNSALRNRKTEVDENIQQEGQKSQSLKPVSEEATWSVSGIAGWLGLGSQPKEEPTKEISETVEQITFRHRKIAITDDSDLKKLNDDSETEPKTWFPSTLTDLMHFGSSKAGFGLLYKENDPDHHDSTTVSDTQEQEPSDSALSQSNWFGLDISDVLTFGYSNENEVRKEKYERREATSKNKESLPPSVYSVGILMDQGLKKQTSESAALHEEQEKHVQGTPGIKKTDSKVQLANEVTGFKDGTDTSVSTETGDKLLESLYAEHDSVSGSEVMENTDTKAIITESERKNDQSGWYDSIYSSIFDFSKVKSGHDDSVAIQRSQESVVGQLLPSRGAGTGFLPKDISAAREEISDSPQISQSVFSFINTLNAQGFASKRKGNVYSSPFKKDDRVFHINKVSKEQLVGNQQVAVKVSSNFDVAPSQENIQLSSLAIKNHEESRGKTQDSELVKDSTSHLWYVKSKLEHKMSNSQHKQITTGGKPKDHTSEIQDNSSWEDKNYTVILENKQCISLELENKGDSLTQQEYTSEIYSHEKIVSAIKETDDGTAVRPKHKSEEVDNLPLPATEIYLEKLSKGEMTEIMQGKEGSSLAIHRKLMFKELKEHIDNFPQLKDNPGEDEVFHDVSDDNKQVIQGIREQMLSASSEIIDNTEVEEIARHSHGKNSPPKCNDVFSNDIADVNKNLCHNQKEDEAVIFQSTQNSAIIPSSLRSPQSRDAPHFREEKPSKFEEPHSSLSFNHYKHLLSFQSSTGKDKDYLQRSQEKISSSDENSLSKNSVELRNIEKKEQSYQKKYKLVSKKEDVSNKDVLLSSLAKQNKTEDFIKDTNLLKDRPPISSEEHPLEHIIESSFNNQKLKDKSTEDTEVEQFPKNKPYLLENQHEPPTLKFSIQKLSQDYKITNEDSILGTQDFNEKEEMQQIFVTKALETEGHTLTIDYSDVMKRAQVSGPESFLQSQSEKHIHYNIERDYVEDSNNENESPPDLKSKGNVFLDHVKDDFPTNSNDNDKLITSIVHHESINHFFQERIKEQEHLLQLVTELNEGKQGDSMQDTKDELKKQTNKNHPNVLNNQEPSPRAMSEELFQREKKVPGNDSCMWSESLQLKDIQVPQIQIAGKHREEEHISKPIQEHFDNTKFSDALATAKAVEGHSLKEKMILSYPSSITFSSKMPVCLPYLKEAIQYLKEDQKDLEVEQEVLSSHPQISDCENSDILSQGPVEKSVCQMVHNTRKHFPQTQDLDVPELGVSTSHKQLNNILNTEAQNTEHTNYEYEQKIVYVKPNITPQLQAVKPQDRVGYDNLVTTDYNTLVQKQPNVAESTENKNPALHLESLELRSQTFHTGHNNNPNKHLSHYMESMAESVDHPVDHVPLHGKHGSDTSHLVIDLNDETFAQNRIIPLPKTLNDNTPFADSGSVRDSEEKSKKCTESDNEIALKNIEGNNGMTGKEGVVDNIFTKTSWFLGSLFQNKHHEESKINKKSTDYIVSQGQEAEILGNDSEQGKDEVQNTKAISYSTDNFKIMEQGAQEEIYKHSQEEYSPIDSRDDSQKDNTFLIQEIASVIQETVKNYKLIRDKEWDLKETNLLSGFQERYINLTQESKMTLQATMCGRDKSLLLQEFENPCHDDIDTFSCEEAFRESRQVISSVEYENKFMTQHKNCLNKKMNSVAELRSLMLDIRNKCEAQKADSGTSHRGQLSDGTSTERNRLNSDKKLNSGHYSQTNKIPPVNIEENICTSDNSGQLNLKERVLLRNMTQNSTFKYEREWLFQIVLYLNDIYDLMKSAFSFMIFMSRKVVAALPENVTPGPNLYGFPWEMVICFAVIALLIVFLLMYRSYQSVRSRLYVGREKQLASKVAELVEDKCKVLEKLSLCKKEYEELENSLKDASLLNEAASASNMKTVCEELSSSNSVLKKEIECLEKELKEEKSKRSQQDDLMAEMQRRMESLENETKSIYQQIAEAKTTLKVYDINRERLRTSVQDAVEENSHLRESEKQLLQEAEGWDERFNELNEQAKMFESSKADMEESLKNKDSQVKSLTECLLKMKDWSCAIGEHDIEDNYWDNDTKEETENGEHLDDQEKRTVRKLIYAAKLNACLKSLETEKNQIYSKLTDENKAKEELAERIENLHREHVVLQSENTHFESEVQKLQQKLKVMTELYQENEMNLHRKLTVEEKERLQKEEKLSKADKRINHAAEELATYRQRAKDLEDELERTVRSYQNQIMSHEKKAHDNWLAARAAERNLNDIRKENLHCRQQLTETEFKYDLLEKDRYALDVPIRAFGREQSPYGPSPMGRPSSETRAFLSPPTLLEGPLRLSPVLPGGGGRGSRGPGNAGIYEVGNEREELSSDRLSNPHRPPSDSGSLSPPWDRDRRIIMPLPAGQPYNDQSLPPRRQERFYPNPPNSGRLSGPAELRSYNMHSFDKTDEHIAENNSRMDFSGNGIKDHPNDSDMLNVSDQPLAPESETFGPGIVPPPLPLLRAPLMPIDPRGPFMRRGPPFPPVPPTGVYGPREYFPRDFASLPRPLLPMRTPFPLRPFSQYPPPRAGFFPPPPPPPQAPLDNSNELPAGLTQQSTSSPAGHQEPQPET